MSKKFLNDYINAFAPVGNESEGQAVWVEEAKDILTDITVDAYGTAYGIIKGQPGYKIGIEAHCDEIGWIVNNINEGGDIRVKRLGGSDTAIAHSKTVTIHTHDGQKIKGVFGSPAIHVKEKRGKNEEGVDPEGLWIDIGFDTAEKVKEAGVEVGNLVTFNTQLDVIGDYYVGKALDNKIGGYIIMEVARRIKHYGDKLPFDLYVINAVQEEVGLFGAKKIAKALDLDICLVHDVCHNTNTPRIDKNIDGDIKGGSGPCIEYTSQNSKKLNAIIREVAKGKGLPLQLTVGSYGNDTVGFFLENIVTAIISTPLKYMHTTVEMAHKDDVENAINLIYNVLINLTDEDIRNLLNVKNE